MNNKKVKEIKEKLKEHYYYLDQAYSDHLAYGGKADEQQEEKIHFFGDILTLINELESEKERLKKDCADIANDYQEMGAFYYEESQKNQQLKDQITELENENERLKTVVDIANEREYRKKFTDEWRKEYQKELDKQGNGHIAGHPDFDLVYKLYFEQKDRIAELEKENRQLSKAINNVQKGFDNGEFISKDCQTRTLKQFVVKAKERCHNYYPSIDHYCCSEKAVSVKDIDELLKEYELRN